MPLQYVIDGYNITNHPSFTRDANKHAKDTRLALLELIRIKKLTGSPNNITRIIFDGYPDTRGSADYNDLGPNLKVIFSQEKSADELIMDFLERAGNTAQINVVSDDKEIRIFARAAGAQVMGVEEFVMSKDKARKADPVKTELNYTQKHKINEELKRLWLKK
ncbi:MAG: NYN domain-containing protein [Candidatus Omnitrophica bacterium]|nr:NYN domain-containing protein [Candidatus Omnitrophota bacterium]